MKKIKDMFLKLDSSKNVYITSDTHYGHTNICRGVTKWRTKDGEIPFNETRDFKTLEEMNQSIVDNINNCVGEDDVLIHLGDWSFGGFENILIFREQIKCKEIHLCLGNHDHHIYRNKNNVRDFFKTVFDSGTIEYKKQQIEVFHYPISSWKDLSKGTIHLHGHTHLNNENKISKGRRMDVGMDGNELKPYLLENVIEMLNNRPIETLLENNLDHHITEIRNIVG